MSQLSKASVKASRQLAKDFPDIHTALVLSLDKSLPPWENRKETRDKACRLMIKAYPERYRKYYEEFKAKTNDNG